MEDQIRRYLSEIGRRGGRKSRRTLATETARQMVRLRDARRALKLFRASCFWSFDPKIEITAKDIPWIAEQLRKHGGRKAWEAASKLCP